MLLENTTDGDLSVEAIDDAVISQANDNAGIALTDAMQFSKDTMKDMGIATHRKNVKGMEDSHDGILRDVFESMVNRIGSNDSVQHNKMQSL